MGGFSYPDQFIYEADPMPEMIGSGVFGVIAVIYFAILMLSLAFSAVTYVLHSWSLYTIAKRRCIRNGWLAWIPVGNLWILGNISDQYQYVVKGKIKNRRKKLLGLGLTIAAVYVAWAFGMLIAMILTECITTGAVIGFSSVLFIILVIFVLAVILSVFQYIAYYDLFRSCDPSNAVLYLLLSIVFSVTTPFFVFACRNRDLGMPPRKRPVIQQVLEAEEEIDEEPEEELIIEEGFAQPEEFEEE